MSYNKNNTYGAIAQLGERCAGSAKVRGSSPLGSIQLKNPVHINMSRIFLFNLISEAG